MKRLAGRGIVRKLALPVLCFGFMLLVSCGGYSPTTTRGAVTIELSTSQTSLTPAASANITATVYDQSNQGVIWAIAPLNFGALSNQTSTNQASTYQTLASITFTAPANYEALTTVTVTATSVSNPNVSTSLQIKALPITLSFSVGPTGLQLPGAAQTLNQGGQLEVTAQVNHTNQQSVTWSLSPSSGTGSIVSTGIPDTVTYIAPASVAAPTPVNLIAASNSFPGVTAALPITVLASGAGPNVAAVTVNGGPVPGQVHANGPFTTVTVCNPGSSSGSATCQIISGILVDTGSAGLRILQSQIPLLQLPTLVDANGNTLENCASLLDGSYVWGPVSPADVYIGAEAALYNSSVGGAIQVISSTAAPNNVPTACSNGGVDRNTPQLLGANGILGIGPEPTDCALAGKNLCDGSTEPVATNRYFSCPSAGCSSSDTSVIASKVQQVWNPIANFCPDCNGTILQFPAVSGAEATLTGLLTFGIGTEPNNSLVNATVYTLDSKNHFSTVLNGEGFASSFLDSGASALLFPLSLPACSLNTQFFCPSNPTSFTATNKGATQGEGSVSFTVSNADNLLSQYPDYTVFSNLAGPEETLPTCSDGSASCSFVWGLPFFYGRTVFTAIDGQTVRFAPATPWWAY